MANVKFIAVSRGLDGARTAVNQLCMAVPSFFTGILLSWVFGVTLRWFTPGSFPGLDHFGGALKYLFFAAVAIAIPRIAMTVRMLRSTIMDEMQKDYVRTAISRGNDRGGVLWHHVLKNALVPVVTFLAQTMAEIVAGSIVVEQVFAIPSYPSSFACMIPQSGSVGATPHLPSHCSNVLS